MGILKEQEWCTLCIVPLSKRLFLKSQCISHARHGPHCIVCGLGITVLPLRGAFGKLWQLMQSTVAVSRVKCSALRNLDKF